MKLFFVRCLRELISVIRTFFNMNPLSCECKDQLPRKESGVKLYGSRSCQLCSSAPSKRILLNIMWPANFCISSPKRIRQKIIWLQIPPTFFISSLKKNLAKNYMAPDPANFLHQLPQKESSGKLCSSRSRQLSASAPSKI